MGREEIWFETDTDREGVDGLEMAVEQLRLVMNDQYRWKWVILGVHNALTCFMCKAVEGSDKLGAMTDRYANAWRKAYRQGKRTQMKPKLADFPVLFARVQSRGCMKRNFDSQHLQPTEDQRVQISRLNRWRTDFVHYKPISLSIEVRGFPEIIENALDVIEFLAFECRNVFLGSGDLPNRTRAALAEARHLLDGVKSEYVV